MINMKLELNKKDRVCFLGDSITADGRWVGEVIEHFLKEHFDLEIRFFNCGISGSKGCEANIKDRLYSDCFNYFPKYTVVMFGMNDIFPWLYFSGTPDENKVEVREARLAMYENTLEDIIRLCEENGSIPIICSPTPYDEYNNQKNDNWTANTPLFVCRDVAEKVSEKHGLIFVDMHKTLMEYMDSEPVGEDRIHPNDFGHHLMAETFLKAIGEKAEIEPDKKVQWSEKNLLRYETEKIIRRIMYVERDGMLWQYEPDKPLDERKRLMRERMEKESGEWIETTGKLYLDNIDYLDVLRGKIVRLTAEMYR